MIVCVCGGRNYGELPSIIPPDELEWWRQKAKREEALLRSFLTKLHSKCSITLMVEGRCPTGADKIARLWAQDNEIPGRSYPADWNTWGKSAGPRRNTQMLGDSAPDILVAAPGGRGTSDCVEKAEIMGIEVKFIIE